MKIHELHKGFTIGFPTWNRLNYVKACVESIIKNSAFEHEIIVHINGCTDGTVEWATDMKNKYSFFDYTYSDKNLGVVLGHNIAINKGTKDVVLISDNDILFFPGWDIELVNFAENNDADKKWWINSTPIEPRGDSPSCIAPMNYGTTIEEFNWDAVLLDINYLRGFKKSVNSNVCPALLWRDSFDSINGLNEELGLGLGAEDDFAFRMWKHVGCRNFVTVPNSLVYHFAAGLSGVQSWPDRQSHMNFRDNYFIQKYAMCKEEFIFNILRRGKPWTKDGMVSYEQYKK
jgi:glycosyltransferase involved in cell wall biosynthesis